MLRAYWASFVRSQRGQDLAEYCLATALVALVALGIFVYASGGIQSIWTNADASLVAGGNTASQSTTGNSTASAPASKK